MNYYVNPKKYDHSVGMFQKMIAIINDFDTKNDILEEEIATLQTNMQELAKRPCKSIVSNTMTSVDLVVNTKINELYIRYIQLYGVPEDGIFLPSLLNQLMNCTTNNFISQSVNAPSVLSNTISPVSTAISSPTGVSPYSLSPISPCGCSPSPAPSEPVEL